MNYNSNFEDSMDTINNTAQGYGFKNGIDWANLAQQRGEISWSTFKKYENAHNLRVRFSHGNARDISISYETYEVVQNFERDIANSSLRKNRGGNSHNGRTEKKQPKLPDGTFRGKPYIKEFKRTGQDGEEYFFKFEVCRENNYLDDGYGGTTGFGYFIHIVDAPYLNYALTRLHEFHIIRAYYDNHICWNKIIDNFEEANAVMYVWVNRYADLIDVLKNDSSLSEDQLVRTADRKHILPSGTFRKTKRGKDHCHKTVYMTQKVYDEIISVLGIKKPELGGMLGFTMDQDTIDTYVFDKAAKVNSVEYNPNIEYLQKIIENEWDKKHIFLGGFVHSHPGDFNRLSCADVEYAQRIMEAFDLKYLFMPIVTSSYEYVTSMIGYIVKINGSIERCNITVVPGEKKKNNGKTKVSIKETKEISKTVNQADISPDMLKAIETGFDSMDRQFLKKKKEKGSQHIEAEKETGELDSLAQDETFARISSVINIPYMLDCSIIGIGCGGARSFYESMARMGVGHFYLMDGDKASYSNIASQNGYISEVGMYKPELIKKRILDINANAKITCFDFMLTDEITDEQLEKDIVSKVTPKRTLICAFTDNFFAQARISRIALKYGIPFISGQHHAEGVTSEVVFWYPEITKYSMREIAKSRYESYEKGYKNDVTSVGSPIFNTTRLNALCEKIAVGMLLYEKNPNHNYCSFLHLRNDRNLILIRQRYITEANPFFDLFDNGINSLFDDVSWINPESFEDLANVSLEEGIVTDTRMIFGAIK